MGYSSLSSSQKVPSYISVRLDWISGHEKYTELQKILEKVKAPETEFFATGYEKCNFLSEILETKATKLDDYAGLNLIFKAEEYHWRCSNYPFCHAKTLHCAERKKEKHLHTEHGLEDSTYFTQLFLLNLFLKMIFAEHNSNLMYSVEFYLI